MTMDEFAGRVQEFRGTMKMVAGKIVADVTLEVEGELDRACGRSRRKTAREFSLLAFTRRRAAAAEAHRYR
ncbi:MAG: hypothetical protein ABI537_09890 [Casimicrobiaceae bacterium]